jgi:D-3-phosphoglycerate dehydrogenase
MYKVLLAEKIHPKGIEMLEKYCHVSIASGIDEETLCREVKGMDALIVRSIIVPVRVISDADTLKVIGRHGMGVDNIDLKIAAQKGITVVNTPVANVNSVIEHIVTFILALSKQLVRCDRAMKSGLLSEQGASLPGLAKKHNFLPTEVRGKKLGLIGLGKIGGGVAHICGSVLGMEVMAYDPYLAEGVMGNVKIIGVLDDLLREADFVSLQVPLTRGTAGMIGYKELLLMKETAFLINASRGQILDEEGILRGLKEKQIAGAALDVYWQEPPLANHELFKLDNVILTPHVAGVTEEALVRMSMDVSQGVIDVLMGREPKYAV